MQVPIPCYLQILNSKGIIVTAAAGVVIPSSGADHGFETVQIRAPVFLPDEPLPVEHQDFSSVGSAAGGIPVMWPENFIDFTMAEPQEASQTITYYSTSIFMCQTRNFDSDILLNYCRNLLQRRQIPYCCVKNFYQKSLLYYNMSWLEMKKMMKQIKHPLKIQLQSRKWNLSQPFQILRRM